MEPQSPISGITVVELGHSVAAPFAGQILGDLGARVVKVEKPDGDDARNWAPPWWHGASAVPYRGYATQDGFRSNPDRVRNQEELYRMIEEIVMTAPSAHRISRLEAAGVPCAPLQSIAEVLAHPQTASLGMVRKTPDGRLPLLGLPLSFDGTRPAIRLASPALGEHTSNILKQERPT